MSKIGKQHIDIPEKVQVTLDGLNLMVKGPRGELSMDIFDSLKLELSATKIIITPKELSKKAKAFWGLARSLVSNMVTGVMDGFSKKLEINGVGYRANLDGNLLILTLGYSHEIAYSIPENIEVKCLKNTLIEVSGCDKQLVGQVSADIRSLRKPEPYKGKGIKYSDEVILRKEGKKK
jgi:large subunit ribosomal protein L6